MNNSLNKLKEVIETAGFTATSQPIKEQIVIHGVAGSGKSTLVNILRSDPNFHVVNPLSREDIDIEGNFVSKSIESKEGKINVLDEYLAAESTEGFHVLLADPFQYQKQPLKANYIKRVTHRFKKELIPILKEIKVEAESLQEGLEIVVGSGYDIEPQGQIIALEKTVIDHITKHSLLVAKPGCVQGQEFDTVTIYHSCDLKDLNRAELYIALTRVKERLFLLRI